MRSLALSTGDIFPEGLCSPFHLGWLFSRPPTEASFWDPPLLTSLSSLYLSLVFFFPPSPFIPPYPLPPLVAHLRITWLPLSWWTPWFCWGTSSSSFIRLKGEYGGTAHSDGVLDMPVLFLVARGSLVTVTLEILFDSMLDLWFLSPIMKLVSDFISFQ